MQPHGCCGGSLAALAALNTFVSECEYSGGMLGGRCLAIYNWTVFMQTWQAKDYKGMSMRKNVKLYMSGMLGRS